MKQNIFETIVGIVVLVTAAFFLHYAYNRSNPSNAADSYIITASFEDSTGVTEGSDIMISGVKVGEVDKIALDKDNFLSTLHLRIDNTIKLGTDSKASITSNGLLGGKVISITPGQSEEIIKASGQIKYTQSAINIESLIGKFMYSIGDKK